MFGCCLSELAKIAAYGEDHLKRLEYATPSDAALINLIYEAKNKEDLNEVFRAMADTAPVINVDNDDNDGDDDTELTTKQIKTSGKTITELHIKKPANTNKYVYAAFECRCSFSNCCVKLNISVESDLECQIIAVETNNAKYENHTRSTKMTITPDFFANMTHDNTDEVIVYIKIAKVPIKPIYVNIETTKINISDTLMAHLALNMVQFMQFYNATQIGTKHKITTLMLPNHKNASNKLRYTAKLPTDAYFVPIVENNRLRIGHIDDNNAETPSKFYVRQMCKK